jgi:hypothetical protein
MRCPLRVWRNSRICCTPPNGTKTHKVRTKVVDQVFMKVKGEKGLERKQGNPGKDLQVSLQPSLLEC